MIWQVIIAILFLNIIAAVITVFREKRDIAATWAWLLVLLLLPGLGFIIYLFAGKKISRERIFNLKMQERLGTDKLVTAQKDEWQAGRLLPASLSNNDSRQLSRLLLDVDQAVMSHDNAVRLYTDGAAKFDALLADIARAQDHIHLEYYTFFSDEIGTRVRDALITALDRGVEVRVIYDSMGSRGQRHSFFKEFERHGGRAEPFLGSKRAPIHSPRLNYREHRKLAIIDGKVGYIGGFNIGDQYLGKSPRFGNWRDTHMRVEGTAVLAMQTRFLMDWNATTKGTAAQVDYADHYFPVHYGHGATNIQVVSSGPDSDTEAIKLGYLKLINSSDHYINIQTPYLIPDDSVFEALCVSAASGVRVRIMIPCMPDHAFVYRATQYYARALIENGVEVYQYNNGFLHAKTFVSDGEICSVGSANVDFRSFKLNFECNAFCYDRELATELAATFEDDLAECIRLTAEDFAKQSAWLKFKQYFSRLLSPIL